jgi:GTP-binding protein
MIENQLLAMPPSMRCLLFQQTVYNQPVYLARRHLSTTSLNLYPRQRAVPSKTSLRPSPSVAPTPESKSTASTALPSEPQPKPKGRPRSFPIIPRDPVSRPQTIVPLSYLPAPSNNPDQTPLPSPPIDATILTSTTTLLTTPPPRFLYSAPRFLHVPINNRVPEICLLGRSNVGKSTLINALAGISSAGRSHGSTVSSAKKQHGSLKGLAITSAKAGCTRTLNGYAFGLPDPGKTQPVKKVEKEVKSGPKTRSERREAQSRNRDTTPAAAMILLDLPGYGQNSQSAWGVEISKYLSRRQQLRGAVLLIDSIAGIKEGDRQVLRLLRDGEIRTSVVLTKADKLGYGLSYSGEERVQQMCASVWEELRKIETKGQGRTNWTEGGERGWEREIWVTGAGDPKKGGGVGVEGARFAIARMAGLVQDERDFEGGRVVVPEQKIVPFENVVWGPVGGREKGARASF